MSKPFSISAERQQQFAELAGDFNPLHTNELYARKTLFGKQVVHGIHQLLFLLERAADKIDAPFSIAQIKADFNNALGVNEPFTMSHTPSVSTTTFASCTRAEGSAPRYCVMRARRAWVAASAAW